MYIQRFTECEPYYPELNNNVVPDDDGQLVYLSEVADVALEFKEDWENAIGTTEADATVQEFINYFVKVAEDLAKADVKT